MIGQGVLPQIRAKLPYRVSESRWLIPAILLAAGIAVFGIDLLSTSVNDRLHWVVDFVVLTTIVPLGIGHLLHQLLTMIRQVRLEKAVEVQETRQAISRELHDSVAQQLCYVHLKLDQLSQDGELAALPRVRDEIENVRQAANEAYEELYGLMSTLRLAPVGSLTEALRERAAQATRRSGLRVNVVAKGTAFEVPQNSVVEIIRIVGEALSNTEKHARAQEATIWLHWRPNALELSVCDNGLGFVPEQVEDCGRFGLKIMRERATRVAGNLQVASAPGAGTSVMLTVPRTAALDVKQTADMGVPAPSRQRM